MAEPKAGVAVAGSLGRSPVVLLCRSVPGRTASPSHACDGYGLRRCVGGRALRGRGPAAVSAADRTLKRQFVVVAATPFPHQVENSPAASPDLRCSTRSRRRVGAGPQPSTFGRDRKSVV